jgi:hypothetical protein
MKPFGADVWPQNSAAFSWVLASRSERPRNSVIFLQAGQTVAVKLSSPNTYLVFDVFADDKPVAIEADNEWSGQVAKSGDYQIRVFLIGAAAGVLKRLIPWLSPSGSYLSRTCVAAGITLTAQIFGMQWYEAAPARTEYGLGPSAQPVDSKHGVDGIGARRKPNASFEGPLRCFVVAFDVSGQSLLRTGPELMFFSISTLLLPGITEIGKEHLLKQRLMGIRMNLVLSESLTPGKAGSRSAGSCPVFHLLDVIIYSVLLLKP